MGRYSKFNSNYILKKKHQFTTQGTIWERDWVTIGERHRLDPGKRAFFGSNNFLFTTNSIVSDQRKYNYGTWVAHLVGDDIVLENTNDESVMPLNMLSHNLADYAYYGSLVELFRASAENIIREFPGNITVTNFKNATGDYFLLNNQFNIDLYHDNVVLSEDMNELRYLSYSWQNYLIYAGSSEEGEDIISYTITYVCDTTVECAEDGATIYEITIATENGVYNIYGVKNVIYDDGRESYKIDFCALNNDFRIEPKPHIIKEYFRTLDYFEALLLNGDSKPLYSNKFLMPKQMKNGFWKFIPKRFTWPSNGYCIDITSHGYTSFVGGMLRMCSDYDEICCDAIWRCMTHESIKNFDRTYSRQYDEETVEENIAGGQRIEGLLRCYGRFFDELKFYVDGIGRCNRINYDGFCGASTDEYPEILEDHGWEVYSTLWNFYAYIQIEESDIPSEVEPVSVPFVPSEPSASDPQYILVDCGDGTGSTEAEYYILTSAVSENTAITYDFINDNSGDSGIITKISPWIEENSLDCFLIKRVTPPSGVTFDENNTFVFPPVSTNSTLPDWVRVIDNRNGGYTYFQKIQESDFQVFNSQYLHNTWFDTVNADVVDRQRVNDNFLKRMILSAREVWKTKGTRHSIDMVMGMFGFGRSENEDESDYSLTELYYQTNGKVMVDEYGDEVLYYYYKSTTPIESHRVELKDEVPEYATSDDTAFPPEICVNVDGVGYYYTKESTSLANLVYAIKLDKTTANYENDVFSGFPLENVKLGNTDYMVPYYYHDKKYDGDFIFQSKGGWGKFDMDLTTPYTYLETISYLRIFSGIGQLFNVDINGSAPGDIYYVANVSDYIEYFGVPSQDVSHYFVLKDASNISVANGWANIPMTGAIQYPTYVPSDANREATHSDYLKAKYLESIVPLNIGNNPHCGYGRYDGGREFMEYMHQPYKYIVDNYALNDIEENYDKVKHFLYNIFGPTTFRGEVGDGDTIDLTNSTIGDWYKVVNSGLVNGEQYKSGTILVVGDDGSGGMNLVPFGRKILDYLFTPGYTQLLDEPALPSGYWNSANTYENAPTFIDGTIYNSSPEYVRVGSEDAYEYYKKVNSYNYGGLWNINDKVLIFKNNIENNLYKTFFRSVIMPYLLQVIPSTTILFFEGLEYNEESGEMVELSVNVAEESAGLGSATGSGIYAKCSKITVSATPGEHCNFVEWRVCETHEQLGTEPILEIHLLEDMCVEAVFEEMCSITYTISDENEEMDNPLEMGYVTAGNIRVNPLEPYYYDNGSTVALRAVPMPCFVFEKWVITCGSEITEEESEELNITIGGDEGYCGCIVGCVFAVKEVTIQALTDDDSYGSAFACEGTEECESGEDECTVLCGNDVTIYAESNNGYAFLKWVDCEDESVIKSFENPYTFVATDDDCYKAVFQSIGVTLTISAQPEEGGVTSFVDGSVFTPGGTQTYNLGDNAVIDAAENSPCYKFKHWFDVDTEEIDTSSQITVPMNGDKTYVAYFEPQLYALSVENTHEDQGTVVLSDTNCNDNEYPCGTALTATAIPNTGYCFDHWVVVYNYGTGYETSNVYYTAAIELIMLSNIKITPVFTTNCQSLVEVVYEEIGQNETKVEKNEISDEIERT